MPNIAVIGAGIAGITAARELRKQNLRVSVFDRGRKLGGRCATRSNDAIFDHGAPFLSSLNENFAAELDVLEQLGVVRQWHGKFVNIKGKHVKDVDSEARYVGVPGMRNLASALATDLDILSNCQITKLVKCAQGWRLINLDDSEVGEYAAVILAMPPEQARRLLPSQSCIFPAVAEIKSLPKWALMASFDTAMDIDFDAAHVHGAPIETIVRQSSKPGRPEVESWVIYSSSDWAQQRLKTAPEVIANELLEELRRITGHKLPNVLFKQAHRWRLALPEHCLSDQCLWDDELLIGLCGDWCSAPSIEGAYLSGEACGQMLAKVFSTALA